MRLSLYLQRVGTIYSSKTTCIYENLAFEEWLFRNHDLQQHGEALLLWSNTPAVVIGRHQNPFLEANLRYCRENAIQIARRHSGGGTVYHDLGNLNISFLTANSRHCRPRNLRLLADQFNRYFGRKAVAPNERDDLIFTASGSKVSGTAARISHGRAYHHLTLLVDAPLDVLRAALHSNLQGKIETNATQSVRAKSVSHLCQLIPDLRVSDMHALVADAFAAQCDVAAVRRLDVDRPADLADERCFAIADELRGEEWIFGRTPRFTLSLPSGWDPSKAKDMPVGGNFGPVAQPRVVVDKGWITESAHLEFPVGQTFYDAYAESSYF